MEAELDVRLQMGPPETLPGGCLTSMFLIGSCFHRRLKVERLEVVVDEESTRVDALNMPRLDLHRGLADGGAEGDDPAGHSYKSGFWVTVAVQMPVTGSVPMKLRARLKGGTIVESDLGSIEAVAPAPAAFGVRLPDRVPRLVICMATYDPDPGMFRAQIDSIRAQTFDDWVCLVSDDCSPPKGYEAILSALEGDDRFVLSRSPGRLGFYRNFERALAAVPEGVEFVALSDQDDVWYPDKLESLVSGIGDAQLIYSDQRIVGEHGEVLAESYWGERSNSFDSLTSMLVANTVTGAASLMRRSLLEKALPFPETPGTQYHDQWLALVALAEGKINYVDRPLYDYVQHGGATLGHAAAVGGSGGGLRVVVSRLRRSQFRRAVSGWRASYFFAYQRISQLARILLQRCGGELSFRDRRMLRRFIRSERSPVGFIWLSARSLRPMFGKNETLGAERIVRNGILWRYAVTAVGLGRSKPIEGLNYDASLPAASQSVKGSEIEHPNTLGMARLIRPLEFTVTEDAPERVNLLIPTVELKHFFGGYITKFNLARKLAQSGVRTRILTVDDTPQLPRDWREQVEAYAGLEGMFDEVEIAFARDHDAPVEINPNDRFIATTWWTAHIADAAVRLTSRERFLYLIQEYEPFTHPMGSWAALSMSTYEMPHVAMFSTELLRKYFAENGYGVFAEGLEQGRRHSMSFQNAITAVEPPPVEVLAARKTRKLLFYARPEAHGARNMFELGLLGLSQAIQQNVFGPEWEFFGIGAVESGDRIGLGGGAHLELLKRQKQGSYGELLGEHDVGLALMCTPHPSLVPLEMASAGLITVTNSFETKTADEMSALSANLITVPPSLKGVVEGLEVAVGRSEEFDERVRNSRVEWSRDWEESFGPKVVESIVELLDAT